MHLLHVVDDIMLILFIAKGHLYLRGDVIREESVIKSILTVMSI